MSLKDELRAVLPMEATIVRIDRDADMHGLEAVEVEISIPLTHRTLTSTFARKNGLSDEEIARLVYAKLQSVTRGLT